MMQRCRWVSFVSLTLLTMASALVAPTGAGADEAAPAAHAAAAEHGGGAVHADPMHANATDELESIQEFRPDLAVVTLIIFLLLVLLLWKFAWKPIAGALDKREASIARNIDEARHNAEQSLIRLAEYESKLQAAADEVRELLAQGRREADAAKEQIIAEAQQVAARERDRAVADIQVAKSAALGEVAQKSAEMAFTLASRIVRRELKPEDHSQLVREAIDQMPSNN